MVVETISIQGVLQNELVVSKVGEAGGIYVRDLTLRLTTKMSYVLPVKKSLG